MTSLPHVAVVGLMGVGKTTLATMLAERLGRPLADTDEELARFVGVHGVSVAATLGVSALHQIERAIVLAALARPTPHVIAPAASVVEDELIRSFLSAIPVVRVVADVEIVHARQSDGDHRRHMELQELREIEDRRAPFFAEVEDIVISSDQPIDAMVTQALDELSSSFEIKPTAPTN